MRIPGCAIGSTSPSGRLAFHVFEGESTGRRYDAQTDDLARRMGEHSDPTHDPDKYATKQRNPWKVVHQKGLDTRPQAMRCEHWLKPGIGRRWLSQKLSRASLRQAD